MNRLVAFTVFIVIVGFLAIFGVADSSMPTSSKDGLYVMMGLFMGASLIVTLVALLIRAVRYDDFDD